MNPKLRKADRYKPLYRLNMFPSDFGLKLGKELIYVLATRENPDVSGDDWEQMFARCIGVEWKKSNVGLEDVVQGKTAWSAKTIKNSKPFTHSHVRLITGRNSVDYSYDVRNVHEEDPNRVGAMVLDIWNARFKDELSHFSDLRTAILIRNERLTEFSVMEIETKPFDPNDYSWDWNSKNNLEGYDAKTRIHRFTWQPHGSQFTHIPDLPSTRLKLRLKKPPMVKRECVLDEINFDPAWIEIVK